MLEKHMKVLKIFLVCFLTIFFGNSLVLANDKDSKNINDYLSISVSEINNDYILTVSNISDDSIKDIEGKTIIPKNLINNFNTNQVLWNIDNLNVGESQNINLNTLANTSNNLSQQNNESISNHNGTLLPSLGENFQDYIFVIIIVVVFVILYLKNKKMLFIFFMIFSFGSIVIAAQYSGTIVSFLNNDEDLKFVSNINYSLTNINDKESKISIFGTIYDENKGMLQNEEIYIESNDDSFTFKTDEKGEFFIEIYKNKKYLITDKNMSVKSEIVVNSLENFEINNMLGEIRLGKKINSIDDTSAFIELTINTLYLEEADVKKIISSNEIILEDKFNLKVGDCIIVEPNDKYIEGISLKITDITHNNDNTMKVSGITPEFQEIIAVLSSGNQSLKLYPLESSRNISYDYDKENNKFNLTTNIEISEKDYFYSSNQLSLDFTNNIYLDYSIYKKKFDFKLDFKLLEKIISNNELRETYEFNKKYTVDKIYFTTSIPLVTVGIPIGIDLKNEFKHTLFFNIEQSYEKHIGFSYSNGKYEDLSEPGTNQFKVTLNQGKEFTLDSSILGSLGINLKAVKSPIIETTFETGPKYHLYNSDNELPYTDLAINSNLSFSIPCPDLILFDFIPCSDIETQVFEKSSTIFETKLINFKFNDKIYENKDDILISDDYSGLISIELLTKDNKPLMNNNDIKLRYDKNKVKNITIDKNKLLIELNDDINGQLIIDVIKYDSIFNISYASQINLNIEKSNAQFDKLSPEIQSIMVTTLVDPRIMGIITPENSDRPSHFLIAKVGDDFWQVRVHSGNGVGHPTYLIKEDDHYVWPVYANVWESLKYQEVIIPNKTKVAKKVLYDKYINDKAYFDSIEVNLTPVTYSFEEALETMQEEVKLTNN